MNFRQINTPCPISMPMIQDDLVILVPDKNMEHGISGLLGRPQAMGIRSITCKIYIHMHRDPGCLRESHNFLRLFPQSFRYALVLFDRHGCGSDDLPIERLENEVRSRLSRCGWNDRADYTTPQKLDRGLRWIVACRKPEEGRQDENEKDT